MDIQARILIKFRLALRSAHAYANRHSDPRDLGPLELGHPRSGRLQILKMNPDLGHPDLGPPIFLGYFKVCNLGPPAFGVLGHYKIRKKLDEFRARISIQISCAYAMMSNLRIPVATYIVDDCHILTLTEPKSVGPV